MATAASPENDTTATATVLRLFQQLHDEIRNTVEALDEDGLNWMPIPETNTIATIVAHLVGSEAETLRSVAGIPCARDRDAEFVVPTSTKADVLAMLDGADQLIVEVAHHIDHVRLDTALSLPTLPATEQRSGLTWLVRNYGHAREHLGHIQMTTQFYFDRRG